MHSKGSSDYPLQSYDNTIGLQWVLSDATLRIRDEWGKLED